MDSTGKSSLSWPTSLIVRHKAWCIDVTMEPVLVGSMIPAQIRVRCDAPSTADITADYC